MHLIQNCDVGSSVSTEQRMIFIHIWTLTKNSSIDVFLTEKVSKHWWELSHYIEQVASQKRIFSQI